MPLIQARYNPDKIDEDALFEACSEVVPAGFCSQLGHITPGSIKFCADPVRNPNHIVDDVFLDIEAYDYEDRRDLDDRAEAIKGALKELFPGITVDIWAKLVVAGWAADTPDPDFDGDMSMAAAIERARPLVNATLLDRKLLAYQQSGEWQPNVMDWAIDRIAEELDMNWREVVDRLTELSGGKCRVISGR